MPVIKSAIKKLRQSKVKTERNRRVKRQIKNLTDEFRKKPSEKLFSKVASQLDKATKSNILHTNKSARLKSRLSKLLKK